MQSGTESDSTYEPGARISRRLCRGLGHDIYQFCRRAPFFGFTTAVIAAGVVFFAEESHPIAATLAVVCTAASVACLIYLYRQHTGEQRYPHFLRERFSEREIAEFKDVQFVVSASDEVIRAGDSLTIDVFAQNCTDAPRTLMMKLKRQGRVSLNFAGFLLDKDPSIELPPFSAGRMTIPMVSHPKARGQYRWDVTPKVTGRGGRRVLRWRARAFGPRVSGLLSLVLLPFGFLVWGGGLSITVAVKKSGTPPGPFDATAIPASQSTVLWTPGNDASDSHPVELRN